MVVFNGNEESDVGTERRPWERGIFFRTAFRLRIVEISALRDGLRLVWPQVSMMVGALDPALEGRSPAYWASEYSLARKAGLIPDAADPRLAEIVSRTRARLAVLLVGEIQVESGGKRKVSSSDAPSSEETPIPFSSPVVERMRAASASDGRSTTFQVQVQGNQSPDQNPWDMLDAKIKAKRDISDKDCEDAGITPDTLIAYVKAYRARSFSNLGALMRKAVFDLAIPYDKSVNDWFKECGVTKAYLEARSAGMTYPQALSALGS